MSISPASFPRKRLRPDPRTASVFQLWHQKYLASMHRQPFLLFGLPFLICVVGGSFLLTPVTALRYERHDRKVRTLSKDEELGLGKDRRRVDAKTEYYRLAAKDLDDWENKRVERLKGESDGVL